MIELDQGCEDRLGAFERQRHMPAVFEPAEDGPVMREPVEITRRAGIAKPIQECRQHRQQRHPLSVHVDPEIEREPPAAALLDFGRPFATAVDDAVTGAVLDLDPPALALELRYGIVNEARPIASSVGKAERYSTTIRAGGAERVEVAQTERLQPVTRCSLGGKIPAADDDPALFDPTQLARGVIGINRAAAINIAEQCNIDPLVPILPPELPIIPAALAIGEQQCRYRRLLPDLLDQVGSRPRQGEIGQVALDQCAECRCLGGRDRRRRERDPDQRPRDIECDRAGEVRGRVDIPGRGRRQRYRRTIVELDINRLPAVGTEPPGKAAMPRWSQGQRRRQILPAAAPGSHHPTQQQVDQVGVLGERGRRASELIPQ
jgi:hypothetical protein